MLSLQKDCRRLMMVIDSVFSWLPLATIIDKKVFVIHGGVSSRTDLSYLDSIDRHKVIPASSQRRVAAPY